MIWYDQECPVLSNLLAFKFACALQFERTCPSKFIMRSALHADVLSSKGHSIGPDIALVVTST